MNRYWTQVPVKVLKYKKLGILCCLVICMKFLLTSTDWTLTGKVRTVREFVSAKDLSTCNCTRGLQDRGVRTILEKTQNGPYEGKGYHKLYYTSTYQPFRTLYLIPVSHDLAHNKNHFDAHF